MGYKAILVRPGGSGPAGREDINRVMRFLFNLFAFLSVASFLLMIGSVGMETLNGYRNFSVSGTELTITFSVLDRVLLVVWLLSMMFAWYFWTRLSNRK